MVIGGYKSKLFLQISKSQYFFSKLNYNVSKILQAKFGPTKVNQKIAFFRSEIWKPGIWNIGSGEKLEIENLGFEIEFETHNSKLLSQRAERKKVQNSGFDCWAL